MPHYTELIDKHSFDINGLACPRCRRRGAEQLDDHRVRYVCGSVFNDETAEFDETKCEFRPLTPEVALSEAAITHAFFALYPDHWTFEPWDKEHPIKVKPPHWPNTHADYLLWDSDVFLQVIDRAESLKGAVVEQGPYMHHIWLFDPALQRGTEGILLGMSVFADNRGIYHGELLHSMTAIDSPPVIIWYPCLPWNTKIEHPGHAKIAAAYTWLQQPYVAQVDGIKHSRQVKRQAERRGQSLPNIRMIEFRRAQGSRQSAEPSSRELHCCFERAGHPRRQWYPASRKHKIIWIAPTLVGDPDLPFKPKGQKLYRVRR